LKRLNNGGQADNEAAPEKNVEVSGVDAPLPESRLTISKLVAMLAVPITIAGAAIHVCGYSAQVGYLRVFNIDPDGFPRSTDWLMFNGYYSAFERVAWLAGAMKSWIAVFVVLYVTLLVTIFRWKPAKRTPPEWIRRLDTSKNIWFLFANFLGSAIGLGVVWISVMIAALLLAMPGIAGESAGKRMARDRIAEYVEGCSASNPCSEIFGHPSGPSRGFVVATSAEHVAIFVPESMAVEIIERAGTRIVSSVSTRWIEVDPNERE